MEEDCIERYEEQRWIEEQEDIAKTARIIGFW